jgi:hypothetical protein
MASRLRLAHRYRQPSHSGPERAEPEHWHHDIRYIVRAREGDCLRADLTEVDKAEWHGVSALEEIAPQALRNMRGLGLIRSAYP